MAEPKPIAIGTILVLREEFDRVTRDETRLAGVRHRAALLVQLLDELLNRREKEGAK